MEKLLILDIVSTVDVFSNSFQYLFFVGNYDCYDCLVTGLCVIQFVL